MSRFRIVALTVLIAIALLGSLWYEIIATRPVRAAVRTCSELFTIANRPGLSDAERLRAATALCSRAYRAKHPLSLAAEGGIRGIPRNLNKNFQAWRYGPNVWICITNRVGPVYQFVEEDTRWRFDGPVAILRPQGELIPISDLADSIAD